MLAIPPTILHITPNWASAACISSSLLFLIYFASLVIYRLYWSPLAKIPGPKLAAATFWYEFYYDVIRRGRYTWKIGELHEEYGMSIREFFVWMEESWGRGGDFYFFFVWSFWLTLYEQAPLCESIHSKYTSTIRIIIITSTRVLPNVERNGLGRQLCLGHLLRISLLYRMTCIVDDAHR